ncbi:DNA helicase/exodeoxyribonuclease V, gamma subunit [Pseudonocardia thermophila]|uniref:RecBCD enzyme subunit RecC n=1 Tax=Pseudonocardia thermophila TaxID=1848 RepID=A0A1M6R9K1_PSETH|nr:exodeoxyribonuclease V subunit gamma [Pseudonocardia thermophila]SHK29106.1 DNA helicase/exodeoxyribonuclease V, gamma subunit [Pseudonocardia thermophila]
MGELVVHRAERADALADALAELLATPLPDPFAAEIVAVPARGIERWLAQRLSHRLGAGGSDDGVCAGVEFPAPSGVVAAAVGGATGVPPDADPWRPARAVWPLLEVIDTSLDEPWCAPLAAHLRAAPGRRYAAARRLAELFAQYAAQRPQLLRSWRQGGGAGVPDLEWQARLWRRLRERIAEPDPAERLDTACAALRSDPALAPLPPRLSLFGPTRLTEEELAVLTALAEHRDVHLWLPHPSPDLWSRLPRIDEVPPRRADPTAALPRHPLLASLGRDVRELQVRLSGRMSRSVHHPLPEPPPTLLGRLQRELRDDAPPVVPTPIGPDDTSVAVHLCHGPDRQVEVLREIVLGLLAEDPTLEPRDIVVLCPDIERFAPLISATFGLGDVGHPGHRLQVRLADRALRQVNPLLDTVERLLELAQHRLTASEVLDLLASRPVRTRFGLDDDDLERLRSLVIAAGVRWGLDAAHRAPYKLDGFPQNTWAAGLDRLLLGVAMPAATRDWLGTALPLDDVDSSDTERLGALAEFVDRLAGVLSGLTGERPLQAWIECLLGALDLLTATSPTEAWQGAHARAELADAVVEAGPHAGTVPLGLADVRGLLAERLRGGPSRASFRTGSLTVATLVPMRSVPHRVVCLLGLDDGAFPRTTTVDGDDLLAREPRVGDRDLRSEDRQLLLDAVCAATERLVVIASGADERTGARRPPAVPLGELLDAIAATAGDLSRVLHRHPLQPFDPRNFRAPAPFSFDTANLAGARAAAGPRVPPQPFLPRPLPPQERDPLPLEDLVAFVEHPVKAFLTQRAGVPVGEDDEEPPDALPVQPDALARWSVGDRLLRDRLAGHDLDRARKAEWRRGALPPGALGDAFLAEVLDEVEPLVAAAEEVRGGEPPTDVDVDVQVPDGRVVGTLSGIHGRRLVRVEFSRLAPKHRLRAWVQLLALTVAEPGQEWTAVTIGRGQYTGIAVARLGPVAPDHARAVLADLVELAAMGRCTPLPLPTFAGCTYAKVRHAGGEPYDALEEAKRAWSAGAGAEQSDPAHRRVWGEDADAEAVFAEPGPPGGEPTLFGTLARRLWEPLLRAEDLVRR